MSRGRPPAEGGADAAAALQMVQEYVSENKLSAKSLGYYSGTSEASAWRALNTTPARWTETFTKIHKFVMQQSLTPGPEAPASLMKAVTAASQGKRKSTAALLRAIADMLDEGAI